MKYSFSDITIGDTIITTDNEKGIVVAIRSYEYINDKVARKSNKMPLDIMPFYMDNVKHKDIWYSTITLAILLNDDLSKIPTYYLIGIDFPEVKEVIKSQKESGLLDKLKKLF